MKDDDLVSQSDSLTLPRKSYDVLDPEKEKQRLRAVTPVLVLVLSIIPPMLLADKHDKGADVKLVLVGNGNV